MDNFRAVRNFFRTQQQVFLVLGHILVEACETLRRRGERRTGSKVQLACINEIQHAILDDFRIYRQILEIRINEAGDDSIGDVADTGLQRQQVLRHASSSISFCRKSSVKADIFLEFSSMADSERV